MGVDKIPVGVVTKEEDRYSNCNFLTFFSYFISQKLLWENLSCNKVVCNFKLLQFEVLPTLPSQQHKATDQRKSNDRNQSHYDCRCIWAPILVIRRFCSSRQQLFVLLANNYITTNVTKTRLTISHLATKALQLQLQKVTEQLIELLPISLTSHFCSKVI